MKDKLMIWTHYFMKVNEYHIYSKFHEYYKY